MLQNSNFKYLCLLYDGSFDGFLTVVFYCFEKKIAPAIIISSTKYQPSFLENTHNIETDFTKAKRVWTGLTKLLGDDSARKLFRAFLSEQHLMEMHLFNFIIETFKSKEDPSLNFSHQSILLIEQANKKVNKEIHRMHAFVRFKKNYDNIYHAVIEPDFDVLPLIASHFEKRYADQQWLIYDGKRSYGIFYDLQTTVSVKLEYEKDGGSLLENQNFTKSKEIFYELLWRSYFNSVNISERKNTKLQLRHMPKRYWKYLSETKT